MRKNLKAGTEGFPTPLVIVGSYNEDDTADAMAVAWTGICSSEPPCVMIAIRKNRQTYRNILQRQAFSVHIPDAEHAAESDYFGLISGAKADKISKTGFHAEKGSAVDAPVFQELPIALECKVLEGHEIGQHIMIIGEIKNISVDEKALAENGKPDLAKAKALMYDQCDNDYLVLQGPVGKAFSDGRKFLK